MNYKFRVVVEKVPVTEQKVVKRDTVATYDRKLVWLRDNLTDKKKRSKLEGLHDYLQNNQDYLINLV